MGTWSEIDIEWKLIPLVGICEYEMRDVKFEDLSSIKLPPLCKNLWFSRHSSRELSKWLCVSTIPLNFFRCLSSLLSVRR
jgi:hypothetical protein